MNDYQKKLYNDLMTLCEDEDGAFYYKDYDGFTQTYRIFNYRLASYSDFCRPGALECRGIMFEIERRDTIIPHPVRLASMPMEKFFNLNENPFTMDLNLANDAVWSIAHKKDGSLISTYDHDGELRLKSKGSIESDQANDAMYWLMKQENTKFKKELLKLTVNHDLTVNLEWCAPHNRVVIGYDTAHLTVLNIRSNSNGKYLPYDIVRVDPLYKEIANRWTKFEEPENVEEFIKSIPSMTDNIEGFVIELFNTQKIKIKTDKYLSIHKCKDNIAKPRRLFEATIMEATDDMKSMFYDDTESLKLIEDMEKHAGPIYHHLVASTEQFYWDFNDLNRKDYAIKAKTINPDTMSLLMNLYLGRENDYKEFAIKRPHLFGLNFKDVDKE